MTQTELPKIGIIGAGWGVRVQIPAFRASGFVITALWSRDKTKALNIAKELDIPFSTNKVEEILLSREVDLVCISTPPHLHCGIVAKAITAGKHVICEKPAALNLSQARKMLNSSKYYPQLLSIIDHELRFLPAMAKMKELVTAGYCGNLLVLKADVSMSSLIKGKYNWWCDESLGGGVLGAVGSHIIDAFYFLTGLQAIEVLGVLRTYKKTTKKIKDFRHITSDDYCACQLTYENEVHATITLNTLSYGSYYHVVSVYGDRGGLVLRNGDLYACSADSPLEELIVGSSNTSQSSPFAKGTEVMISCLKEAFLKKDFSILQNAANFEAGLHTQAIIDGIKKSSFSGEWINVQHLLEDKRSPETVFFHQ
ncbi:glucose-fructose oxidoreductase domain-containing protein 2-like [Zophobas morio]|uniref:glucose-fructose oxidoreductase domain-containing protein 2-like n=1 Tax=Zophobas morio TaxID=2755281 RepID=UPI003082FE40